MESNTQFGAWHDGELVGRDRELAALARALDALAAGTPLLVEIAGAPGIGKTRLLTELASLARARGVPLVAGRAPGAVRALHALRTRDGLAAPTVLAVDDLHRAGGESADLVEQLLLDTPPATMLVVAHRPQQSPARLRRTFDDAPALVRLQPAPLSRAETSALLSGRTPRAWHDTLHQRSQGNPFYLKALLRFPPPYLTGGDLDAGELPPAVRTAVAEELEELTPAARQAACAAAIVDDQIEPAVLAGVARLGGAELLAAIDELVLRNFIVPIPGTGRFRFRHPVLRHAIYQGTEPGWRLGVHTRAARLLRHRHAPPVAQAAHLARVGTIGDASAVRVLADAADAVAREHPLTAVRWLQAALRLAVAQTVPPDELAALRWRLCRSLSRSGKPQQCCEILTETAWSFPDRADPQRLAIVAFAAQLERYLRRPDRSRSIVRTNLAAAAPAAPALALELACADLRAPRAAQARTHAAQALAAAQRNGDRIAAAGATSVMVVADCLAGAFPTATAELPQAVRRLDELSDHELAQRLDTALWIGIGLVLLDQPESALRRLGRAVEIGAEQGEYLVTVHLLYARAVALRAVGRLAAAAGDADTAADLAAASGSRELGRMARCVQRWLAGWTGEPATDSREPAGPDEPFDPGLPTDPEPPDLFAILNRAMRAEARLTAGDHLGCLTTLAAVGDSDLDPWSAVGWGELRTRAAVRAGRYQEADEWAGRAESAAKRAATEGRLAVARLARAQALAPRAPSAATTAALAAAEGLASAGLVLDAGRARAVAGSALVATGELDRALNELDHARDIFAACGAHGLARDVAARRRGAGGRLPRGNLAAVGIGALTRREREVASLVSSGMTNRQIATRLFVTVKTVEMHLSHVFAKLDVLNRAGVAREFSRATS